MALNIDQLNTDTRIFYEKTLTDQVHDRIPVIWKLRRRKRVAFRGGTEIRVGTKYARNTQGEHYAMGSPLNSGTDDKRTAAKFTMKYYQTPMKFTGQDEVQNTGDQQVFNTMTEEVNAAQEDTMEYLSDRWFDTSPGTDSGVNPQGALAALSTTSTYGDIARNGSNSWWNGSVNSNAVTLTLAAFRTGYQTILQFRVDRRNVLCVTTSANFQTLQALLQPQTQVPVQGEMAKAGFVSMMIDGIEIVIDDNCPANYMFLYDLSSWAWYISSVRNFKLTEWDWQGKYNNGTDEFLARIILAHNWISRKPRANHVWTNIS